MIELLKTIQVIGLKRMFKLYKAHRYAWKQIISGFYTTRTMQALFNVGFFDELVLKGNIDIDEFARSKNFDAIILQALCDYLFALSILKKNSSGYYSLDSKGPLLVEEARGWFNGTYGYEEVFHFLEDMLKKEKVYGKDIYRRPDFVAKGSGEAENLIYFPLAIDMIAKNGFKKVLDLGCGEGTFLQKLCKSNKDVTGYGIDISPEAISDGKKKVIEAGLQDRIHLLMEDISKIEKAPKLLQDIDAATIFFVLHEILWQGTEPVVELLRSFRKIFPGVPLIVFEVIKPSAEEMRKKLGMAVQYLLQHDLTHQKLVGRENWRNLFENAGFNSINERYLGFVRTAIYTLR